MQEVEHLFVDNPFAAQRFLAPLLAIGAFASAALTVADAVVLWCYENEGENDRARFVVNLSSGWVIFQMILQIIQAPVRLLLYKELSDISGTLDQATAQLRRLSNSKVWVANKNLGLVHAIWCAVGAVIIYMTFDDPPIRRLLLLHVVTFMLRCVLTTMWFAYTFAWELPAGAVDNRQVERNSGAAKKLVDRLPTVYYRTEPECRECDNDRPRPYTQPTCVICLQDYEEGEALRLLGCGHYWHGPCLANWLAHRRTCPLCQRWDARPPSKMHMEEMAEVWAAAPVAHRRFQPPELVRRQENDLRRHDPEVIPNMADYVVPAAPINGADVDAAVVADGVRRRHGGDGGEE